MKLISLLFSLLLLSGCLSNPLLIRDSQGIAWYATPDWTPIPPSRWEYKYVALDKLSESCGVSHLTGGCMFRLPEKCLMILPEQNEVPLWHFTYVKEHEEKHCRGFSHH